MNDREELSRWIASHLPDLESGVVDRILEYRTLLEAESERSGIVSRKDRPRLGMRHIRECLAPELLTRVRGKEVLDIGSGGGLPGVPLALAGGCASVTLLEPRERRALFLERALIRLGISGCRVREATLEEVGREDEVWDLAVARGVGWTGKMVRALRQVVRPEGALLRFGPPHTTVEGVEVAPIDASDPRGLHIWPAATWSHLTAP